MQEFFKIFGFDYFVEDCFLVFVGELDFFVKIFDVFFQLVCFFGVGDMYVLQCEGIVIGVFYDVYDLMYGCDLQV